MKLVTFTKAAVLLARTAQIQCKLEALRAKNQYRDFLNEEPAYGEDAFNGLAEQLEQYIKEADEED